jgi:uncharacterized protein YbjT (DUF2867 family)
VDCLFTEEEAPTTYLLAAFYWENFTYIGMGPRKGTNGEFVLSIALGGAKLPGIAAEDIGGCAHGQFRRGASTAGQRYGIAGESLSGPEMAANMANALGRKSGFLMGRLMVTAEWVSPAQKISAICSSIKPFSVMNSSAAVIPNRPAH